MTKTVARHRAPLSARAWVARTWLAVSTLPAGALAGCATVGVAAAVDRPVVGLLGLGALVLPLSVATWRSRLTDVDPAHGRRAAGRPLVAEPATATATATATADLERLPIVLDVPDLASLQAATRASEGATAPDAPSRVFTVAAGGAEVEVVVLTREERAASDLALLQELDAATSSDAPAEQERVAA